MARSYRLGFWRRLINRLIHALLGVGAPIPQTYLLRVRGRKSGRIYSTPVTLVEVDERRWLVAPYGEVAWVKNARAAGEVTLERRRKAETVTLVELAPEAAAPILKRYLRRIPIVRPFFDVTAQSNEKDFVREAPRHPVFRIQVVR